MNKAERGLNMRDGLLERPYQLCVEGITVDEAEPGGYLAAPSWWQAKVTAALNVAVRVVEGRG